MPTLPNEPYPGLRPFLDHEAPLLMGRAHQVREIIKRLETTRFVAVVGGSGCGKSSLIRAGVVPKLRGFGMPVEGDYWVPVVHTPGTTRTPASAAVEEPWMASNESPITRLARKFSQVLEPAPTGELEASRREEIATVFRQGAGFARLVEGYSDELQAAGPEGAQARFVFVIDQFEELFHPNNHGSADAVATIEAVISHFYNPHERCFVVLTMRSEHLADCAAYLQLPDAINRSLYLVRRLNEHEIREAIVGPAKYYLRLKQRAYEASLPLPADVTYDEPVIERLLEDVTRIANDADHLPLLQHLLARTWYAACQREQTPVDGVPANVRWEDLERAVAPASTQPRHWLGAAEHVNTLRSSLENWAEYIYERRSAAERSQIDAVLRKLAFRDPNSGLYFQQRLDVDDPTLQPGVVEPRQRLRKLLERGFLDTVNYLFWDDENPDRVTLKVSHEAFIRGWDRFRRLIDHEAERFEEFVSLLRKCAMWKAEGSPATLLLESSELARIEAAKLKDVFAIQDQRRAWFQHLLEYRDGARLSEVEPQIDEFLFKSNQQVEAHERERRDAALREEQAKADALIATAESKRNRGLFKLAGYAALAMFLVLGFIGFIHLPVMYSVMAFNDARDIATSRDNRPGDDQGRLQARLRAARLVEETKRQRLHTWVVDTMQWLPPFTGYKQLLDKSSSEPDVNGALRDLLTTTVWSGTIPRGSYVTATVLNPSRCQMTILSTTKDMPGMLVQAAGDPSRAIFVNEEERPNGRLLLYSATLFGERCAVTRQSFYDVPKQVEPAIVVDAQLAYMAVVRRDSVGSNGAMLFALQWGLDPANPSAQLRQLPPVIDVPGQMTAAEYIRSEVSQGGIGGFKPVKTWLARAGSVVNVGGRPWRLFANTAVSEPPGEADAHTNHADSWTPLQEAPAGRSACGIRPTSSLGASETFEHDSICFELALQPSQGPPGAGAVQPDPIWVLTAYRAYHADGPGASGPSPLASFPVGAFSSDKPRLWVGKPNKPWAGWLALERPQKALDVAPWSTAALARLGCEVLQADANTRNTLCPPTVSK